MKTFAAQVTDGRLQFQESLVDLEGQHVLVTLVPSPDCEPAERSDDVDAPDWMSVEQEVVFRMPFRWEHLQAAAIEAGAIHPTVVLPEDASGLSNIEPV